jgi:polysaccharide export outer membrane protein
MKGFRAAIVAMLGMGAMVLGACASSAAPPAKAPQVATAQQEQSPMSEYRLGTGDEIKITVFNEPTLSGPFVVDGTGFISMSLIGEVKVKDLTLREVQRAIETKFRDGQILKDPQVAAEMTKGRPYYISGEVNRPGEYPFVAGLTMMNAIISAGDFTYRANRKTVVVKSADSQAEHEVTLTPTTQIRPGDMIRIKERFF